MKVISLFLFLLIPFFTFADLPSWVFSSKKSKQKWGIVPVYAKNSTYGHVGGLRGFIYPTSDKQGYYTVVNANVSQDAFVSVGFQYQHWQSNGNQFIFNNNYSNFHDYYYGEGNRTRVKDLQLLPSRKIYSQLAYLFQVTSRLYFGLFSGIVYRKQEAVSSIPASNEMSVPIGMLLRYDFRNDYFNPSFGEYYQLKSWMLAERDSPLFVVGDIRLFFSVLDKLVLAQNGQIAFSFFNPASYSFRFSLGGSNTLRGFHLNRFRGENYYLSQTELRWTVWGDVLTVVGFFDLGAIGETLKGLKPRYSYGGGVRIGMPPNYSNKFRVEFGVGEDQKNLVISFLHPF